MSEKIMHSWVEENLTKMKKYLLIVLLVGV